MADSAEPTEKLVIVETNEILKDVGFNSAIAQKVGERMSKFASVIKENEEKAGEGVAKLWNECQKAGIPEQLEKMMKLLEDQRVEMKIPAIEVSAEKKTEFFDAIQKKYGDKGIQNRISFTAIYNEFAWSNKED